MPTRGHIQNGAVLPDDVFPWPDGTEVVVDVVHQDSPGQGQGVPTLYERLKDFVGIADDLPVDLAENHDHYLHGRPKK